MNNEELTRRVVDLDEHVARHAEQIKTCFNQIGETRSLTQSMHKLATTVEILAHEQQATNKKMDKLTLDVEEMKEKPGKRWDTIVGIVITAVVTAIITFVLTHAGLK